MNYCECELLEKLYLYISGVNSCVPLKKLYLYQLPASGEAVPGFAMYSWELLQKLYLDLL
jgi:hypothetical protein